MSETDDTDILLLIPPDFFLVRSSEESTCTETPRTVVPRPPARRSLAALHESIGSLEHRVTSLELTVSPRTRHSSLASVRKTPSLDKLHTFDRRSFTFPRRRRRKVYTKRRNLDVSINTSSSSSCREIPPLAVCDAAYDFSGLSHKKDSFRMDSEVSSVVSSPSKITDKFVLNEIDDFLNKVDSYESPEFMPRSESQNFAKTGECTRTNLESDSNIVTLPSGRTVPQDFLDRYILAKNRRNEPSISDRVYEKPTSEEVTPIDKRKLNKDVKSSARKLNFNEPNKEAQVTSTPNLSRLVRGKTVPNMQAHCPVSNKRLERASKVLEQYNLASLSTCDTISNISSYLSPNKDIFKYRKCNSDQEQRNERSRSKVEAKFQHSIDTDLLSLSELWSEQDGLRLPSKAENAKLEEERFKREHCESVIQELQKKVLDQQEKIAVAVKVDRAKDNAISRLREAWVRVTNGLETAEAKHKAALEKMNCEMAKLRQSAEEAQTKTRHFENEMYKTLDLAHDYQEKCKQAQREKQALESEREILLAEKAELMQKRDEDMERLRENYESVMRLNKQLTDCVRNTEENLDKERESHTETRKELSSAHDLTRGYQEELTLLQQERDLLKEKVKEERSRGCLLEKQLADVQSLFLEAQKNEKSHESEVKTLRKHLELQKEELKSYYQKQLEEAVLAKLREFQQQLDTAEKEMEKEAKERENSIVDAFNKRIQRIEEQHKLEVNLLEEKQREEIKLYRLQIAQAGEKIGALESKVDSYRRRRGELASQLHVVMENQWRQALHILTSPSATSTQRNSQVYHEPPQDSRQAFPPTSKADPTLERLSVTDVSTDRKTSDGLSDSEIQHYVKMLLSKPPDVLDDSNDRDSARVKCEPDEEPTKDRTDDRRGRKNSSKPPWKA